MAKSRKLPPFPEKYVPLLGVLRDSEIAERAWVSVYRVRKAREKRGLRNIAHVKWTAQMDCELGTISDAEFVKKFSLRVTPSAVAMRRRKLGIPTAKPYVKVLWTPALVARLGKVTDRALADTLGCHPATVGWQRRQRGITAKRDTRKK